MSFLQCFYDLVSSDAIQREKSSVAILTALIESQKKFRAAPRPENAGSGTEDAANNVLCSDLAYSLKRLIRGLTSSRDMARFGFATTLTEVCVNCIFG